MSGNAKFTKHFYEDTTYNDSIYLGPLQRLDQTFYPYYILPESDHNRSEYYRDNRLVVDGTEFIRDESDYELLNCVIHPCSTNDRLVITPKRLAADPGHVISDHLNGYPAGDSITQMNQTFARMRNKYRQNYRRTRQYRRH